jgi:hypothetical protein
MPFHPDAFEHYIQYLDNMGLALLRGVQISRGDFAGDDLARMRQVVLAGVDRAIEDLERIRTHANDGTKYLQDENNIIRRMEMKFNGPEVERRIGDILKTFAGFSPGLQLRSKQPEQHLEEFERVKNICETLIVSSQDISHQCETLKTKFNTFRKDLAALGDHPEREACMRVRSHLGITTTAIRDAIRNFSETYVLLAEQVKAHKEELEDELAEIKRLADEEHAIAINLSKLLEIK